MPKIDPKVPIIFERLGVVAWKLPQASVRHSPAHSHAEAQLCGLDAGLAILGTESGTWTCPPGRCVWIPPNSKHSLRSCGKISGWMVRLDAAALSEFPSQPRVLALTPLLKQIVARMMTWNEDMELGASVRHLLNVFGDEVCSAAQIRLHLPLPGDPALVRLATRLAERSEAAADLASLAREVGLSKRSLYRKFQKETGLSPGQWRTQMKVLRSFELLAVGQSVTQTAFEVGYESVGAFTRAFRQIAGSTPTEYAREQQGL